MIDTLFTPLELARGAPMRNRFMLAPLTNLQADDVGTATADECHWLEQRAIGGFAMVNTGAAYISDVGRAFPRQLGVSEDAHVEGLSRMAAAIKRHGALAAVQLQHAGSRAAGLRDRFSASGERTTSSRALRTNEIGGVVEEFARAAKRAELAGFDGIQIHGAHGYLLNQFLAPRLNRRTDRYGGSLENRARIYFEVLDAIRALCGPDFQVGLRISPDRFDTRLEDDLVFAQELMTHGQVDYLDLSVGDVSRECSDPTHGGRTLLSYFTELDRGKVRLGAAGQINSGMQAAQLLAEGLDYVSIGTAAILHHDFPMMIQRDASARARPIPVTAQYLENEGLGPKFIDYMRTWPDFVEGGELL